MAQAAGLVARVAVLPRRPGAAVPLAAAAADMVRLAAAVVVAIRAPSTVPTAALSPSLSLWATVVLALASAVMALTDAFSLSGASDQIIGSNGS